MMAAGLPRETFATVRNGVSAGEALPARMFHGVREQYGFEILDGIGSTEALHIFISNVAGKVVPGSSGFPVPGYRVELRRPDGTVIEGSDEPGMLWVAGESLCTGYWCRTDVNRLVFHGEWMRTGDTYVRGADGSWTCLGRADDVLKVGGIWVSPTEVETRILEHPAVAEAVVVGVPDEDGLDKPVAYVVAMPDATIDEAEIIAFCRAGLASFKRPRKVVTLDRAAQDRHREDPALPAARARERIFYNILTFGIVVVECMAQVSFDADPATVPALEARRRRARSPTCGWTSPRTAASCRATS